MAYLIHSAPPIDGLNRVQILFPFVLFSAHIYIEIRRPSHVYPSYFKSDYGVIEKTKLPSGSWENSHIWVFSLANTYDYVKLELKLYFNWNKLKLIKNKAD